MAMITAGDFRNGMTFEMDGFGHSLGIEIHEDPGVHTRNDTPIPAGALLSAEPGIYLPGKFGVRIEDVIMLTEDGCIDITRSPKQLIIL